MGFADKNGEKGNLECLRKDAIAPNLIVVSQNSSLKNDDDEKIQIKLSTEHSWLFLKFSNQNWSLEGDVAAKIKILENNKGWAVNQDYVESWSVMPGHFNVWGFGTEVGGGHQTCWTTECCLCNYFFHFKQSNNF